MIICSSRNYFKSFFLKTFCKCLCILNHLDTIVMKLWFECFSKSDSFCCNQIFMWTSLNSWKYCFCYFISIYLFTHNHPSSWTAQRFMGCCSDNVTVRNWVFKDLSCHKSSYVSDISHENRSYFVSNFTKTFPIKISTVC